MFVHPVLVHLAHLWGCVFWQKTHSILVNDESKHYRLALDSLADGSRREPTPVEALQANMLLTSYAYLKRDGKNGIQYLRAAAGIIHSHKLHIFDVSDAPPTNVSEESQSVCWHLCFISTPFSPIRDPTNISRRLTQELDILLVSS